MRLAFKANVTDLRRQKGNVMAEYMVVAVTLMIAFYFAMVGWSPGERDPLNNTTLPDISGQGTDVPGIVDAMKLQQNNFTSELAKP